MNFHHTQTTNPMRLSISHFIESYLKKSYPIFFESQILKDISPMAYYHKNLTALFLLNFHKELVFDQVTEEFIQSLNPNFFNQLVQSDKKDSWFLPSIHCPSCSTSIYNENAVECPVCKAGLEGYWEQKYNRDQA